MAMKIWMHIRLLLRIADRLPNSTSYNVQWLIESNNRVSRRVDRNPSSDIARVAFVDKGKFPTLSLRGLSEYVLTRTERKPCRSRVLTAIVRQQARLNFS